MRDGAASITICGKRRLRSYRGQQLLAFLGTIAPRGQWLFVFMEVSWSAAFHVYTTVLSESAVNRGNGTERVKPFSATANLL